MSHHIDRGSILNPCDRRDARGPVFKQMPKPQLKLVLHSLENTAGEWALSFSSSLSSLMLPLPISPPNHSLHFRGDRKSEHTYSVNKWRLVSGMKLYKCPGYC